MMNRNKKEELPKMQIQFIDSICWPVYDAFAKLCPSQLQELLQGVEANRKAWEKLADQPYQLTIRSPTNVHSFTLTQMQQQALATPADTLAGAEGENDDGTTNLDER